MGEVKNIAVIGAGAMGAQIALLAAESGYKAIVRDVNEECLGNGRRFIEDILNKRVKKGKLTEDKQKDIMSRLAFTTDVKECVKDADMVIEAVPEIMEIKHKVFKEVYDACPRHTILATNTSSFEISDIAEVIPEADRGRIIGTHFFNPLSAMKIIELIPEEHTSEKTKKLTEEVMLAMDRFLFYCRKDSPGFVTVRFLQMFGNECIWTQDLGESDMVTIDAAVKYRLGLPMGTFEMMDTLAGGAINIANDASLYLESKFGHSYRPPPLVKKLFKAGHLGMKTGRGFYDWTKGQKNEIPFSAAKELDPIRILAPTVNETAKMLEEGLASVEELDNAIVLSLAWPRGPLRMADSIGLDKIVDEVRRLHKTYKEARYKCSPMLAKLVKQGKLGRKTGEGFYSYGPGKYELITLDVNKETRVAKLTLNRPRVANSLNADLYAELNDVVTSLDANSDIGCLVITGAGKIFSAGADVGMFGSADVEALSAMIYTMQDLLTNLETVEKPIIAAINGPCLGGGLELAAACDIRIAKDDAILGFPELNLGLFPGSGGTQRISRLIGVSRAKELILGAQSISADKALEYGLVTAVAGTDEFNSTVEKMATKLASHPQPALGIAKRVIHYGAQADQRTGLFLEGANFPRVLISDNSSEGITAFMYRRAPKFKT